MIPAGDLHDADVDSLDWVPDPTPKRKRSLAKTPGSSAKKAKRGRAAKAINTEADDGEDEQRGADTPTRGRERANQRTPHALDEGRFPHETHGKGRGRAPGYDPLAAGPSSRPSQFGPAPASQAPSQAELVARANARIAGRRRQTKAEEGKIREEIERRADEAAATVWRTNLDILSLVAEGRLEEAHELHEFEIDEIREELGLPRRRR